MPVTTRKSKKEPGSGEKPVDEAKSEVKSSKPRGKARAPSQAKTKKRQAEAPEEKEVPKVAKHEDKEILITNKTVIKIDWPDPDVAALIATNFVNSTEIVQFLYSQQQKKLVDINKYGVQLFPGSKIAALCDELQPACQVNDRVALIPILQDDLITFVARFMPQTSKILAVKWNNPVTKKKILLPHFVFDILKFFIIGKADDISDWLDGRTVRLGPEILNETVSPDVVELVHAAFKGKDPLDKMFYMFWTTFHQHAPVAIQEVAFGACILRHGIRNSFNFDSIPPCIEAFVNLILEKANEIPASAKKPAALKKKDKEVKTIDDDDEDDDDEVPSIHSLEGHFADKKQGKKKVTHSLKSPDSESVRTPAGHTALAALFYLHAIFGEFLSNDRIFDLARELLGPIDTSIDPFALACELEKLFENDKTEDRKILAAQKLRDFSRKKFLICSWFKTGPSPVPQSHLLPNLGSPTPGTGSSVHHVTPGNATHDDWITFIESIVTDIDYTWKNLHGIVAYDWTNASQFKAGIDPDTEMMKFSVLRFLTTYPEASQVLSTATCYSELIFRMMDIRGVVDTAAKQKVTNLQNQSFTIFTSAAGTTTTSNHIPKVVRDEVLQSPTYQAQLAALHNVDSVDQLKPIMETLDDVPRVTLMADFPPGTSNPLKFHVDAAKSKIIFVLKKFIKTNYRIALDDPALSLIIQGSFVEDGTKNSYFKIEKFSDSQKKLGELSAPEIKLVVQRLLHILMLIWPTEDVAQHLEKLKDLITLAPLPETKLDELVTKIILQPWHNQCVQFKNSTSARTRPSVEQAVTVLKSRFCTDEDDLEAELDAHIRRITMPATTTSTTKASVIKTMIEIDSSSDDERDVHKNKSSKFQQAWRHALSQLPAEIRTKYEKFNPNSIITDDDRW
eukprot:CAMPEP_0197307254 /NCGR_PEP_ID=MMETSP0891-20130614/4827_1 /TAXON_ID=44058 ORGANISM="Aureoumbra lagunensis, Strain CCMP1510" /NCGR_SAMPLE_ID=MMETSP0891 /ASSEMBLY_ACC=CAM_ASM_000534 /LENGTH=903 /DNA_ID=CAMNT_0042790429 /DNA_START=82 /DNA_END=2790 /DNA_ORIENTATION=-